MSNILIVEPDKILAKIISEILSSNGHETKLVSGAQEAVLSIEENEPDLIVLEVLLKSHNGIEFLYEIRSYTEWQKIPVIIYSRISKEELGIDSKLAAELNVSKILYKPDTSMKKLVAIIEGTIF